MKRLFTHALAGFAACVIAAVGIAASAETLRMAHFMSPMHPMDRGVMTPLAEAVEEASAGDLKIRIFPAGELGKGPTQQYKRVVSGVADIAFGIPAYTATQFPKTTLVHMPGLFADGETATNALWDNLGLVEDEYAETKLLGLWTNNPAVFISRDKPVRTLEDVEGMKVRAPNPVMAEVIRAWGGVPISIPVTEVYSALDIGVIDAVIVGPSGIRSYRLNEIASYITTNLPTAVDSFYLLMNKGSWDALDADQQATLEGLTGREMSLRGSAGFYAAGQAGLELARESGVEMIEADPAEVARFRDAMQGAVEDYVAGVGADAGVDAAAIVSAFAVGS